MSVLASAECQAYTPRETETGRSGRQQPRQSCAERCLSLVQLVECVLCNERLKYGGVRRLPSRRLTSLAAYSIVAHARPSNEQQAHRFVDEYLEEPARPSTGYVGSRARVAHQPSGHDGAAAVSYTHLT